MGLMADRNRLGQPQDLAGVNRSTTCKSQLSHIQDDVESDWADLDVDLADEEDEEQDQGQEQDVFPSKRHLN